MTGQETVLETASFDISNGKDLVDRILNRVLAGIREAALVLL